MSPSMPSWNPPGTLQNLKLNFSKNLHDLLHNMIPPTENQFPNWSSNGILDGSLSSLYRVDITPLKPKCNDGRVLLNPNEIMAPRALQNERSNHNPKWSITLLFILTPSLLYISLFWPNQTLPYFLSNFHLNKLILFLFNVNLKFVIF